MTDNQINFLKHYAKSWKAECFWDELVKVLEDKEFSFTDDELNGLLQIVMPSGAWCANELRGCVEND